MELNKNEMLSRACRLAKEISHRNLLRHEAGAAPEGSINDDSICHGKLGISFFFLELYKATADPAILEEIQTHLAYFRRYHASNPTNNYALFMGRSGIIYFYLELYRATKNAEYLHQSAGLLRGYLQTKCYSFIFINNDGLFDGLAGILVLLLQLLPELKDPGLIQPMETIVLTLLDHFYIGTNTIHAGTLTNKHRTRSGLGKGPSGIAFAFCELGKLSLNPVFFEIAAGLLNYEDEHWVPALANRQNEAPDPCLADGICGVALTRLYVSQRINKAACLQQWSLAKQYLETRVQSAGQLPRRGICHGSSGIGMTLLEGYRITGDHSCLDMATSIGFALSETLERSDNTADFSLDDLCGAGYYLLKLSAASDPSPSDTSPGFLFLPQSASREDASRLPENSLLSPVNQLIREQLIRKHFPVTCTSLKEFYPEWINKTISGPGSIWPETFMQQACSFLKNQPRSPQVLAISDAFEKECFSARIQLKLMTLPSPGKDTYVGQLEKILGLDDESFLNVKLVLSPNIWIFYPERQPQTTPPANAAPGLDLDLGMNSFVCQASHMDTFYCFHIGLERLILDRFTTPKTIRQAINELMFFLSSREEAIKGYLIDNYRFTPGDNFQLFLRNLFLEGVRSAINRDLLQASDNLNPVFDRENKIFSGFGKYCTL